jgi:hypothetical protein
MATVTPNFNWPVPTSTDLVKDGATAIEALGDSIDGSLVDLKGGTTGQVLSKTSGTDMDFTWVTSDDANAIQNSIVDAKGDLISATANDTPARLAVGNNGETLVADSSATTGLRYQPTVAAGKNAVINGGMDIWQRGTSFTPTSAGFNYCADRWYSLLETGTSGMTITRSTDAPTGFQYSLRTQRTNGTTGTGRPLIYTAVETSNSIPFAGQTVTMSIWVKKGANYSGGAFSPIIYSGTGTDQGGYPSIWSGSAGSTLTITPTTSWVRYSTTYAVPSGTTQLGIQTGWSPSGTAGADDSLYFTGVQIEVGSVATQFTRTGGSIQGELSACQRYYVRAGGDSAYQAFGVGNNTSSSAARIKVVLPVQMRVAPTSIDFSTLAFTDNVSATRSISGVTMAQNSKTYVNIDCTGSSSWTTGGFIDLVANNSTSAFLGFSAEL